jgi:hypothetical protein
MTDMIARLGQLSTENQALKLDLAAERQRNELLISEQAFFLQFIADLEASIMKAKLWADLMKEKGQWS